MDIIKREPDRLVKWTVILLIIVISRFKMQSYSTYLEEMKVETNEMRFADVFNAKICE